MTLRKGVAVSASGLNSMAAYYTFISPFILYLAVITSQGNPGLSNHVK